MSLIRPWTNGDQVPLSELKEVPVVQADKTVWLYDAAGNPLSATGTSLDVNVSNIVPITMADRQVNIQDTAGDPIILQAGRLPVASELYDAAGTPILLNSRDHLEVEIASQISPPVIINAHQSQAITTLSADIAAGVKVIPVTSTVGAVVGELVFLTDPIDPVAPRFFQGIITVIVVGVSVAVSVPIDQPYLAADTNVVYASQGINVDGSVTTQIFSLRSAEVANVAITLDITRFLMAAITANPVNLSLFADRAILPEGILVRKKFLDGTYQNIVTLRSNFDMSKVALDWRPYEKTNPAQGIDGFAWRLTFGGEEKMGTVIRVAPGEDLEVLVQDALNSITTLEFMFEGATVVD